MGNLTLLELHVSEGDIQLGPKALRRSKTDAETESADAVDESDDTNRGRLLAVGLVTVGVIAVLALIATKFLGEDADDEIAGFEDSN